MPKRYAGRELLIEFEHQGRFGQAGEDACIALGLPRGETVRQSFSAVDPGGQRFTVYAKCEHAEQILNLPKGSRINAKVRTVFGHGSEHMGLLGERPADWKGLLVLDLIP